MEPMHPHLRRAAATAITLGLLGAGAAHPGDRDADRRVRDALLDAVDLPVGWASDSEREARRRGVGVPQPQEDDCRGIFDSGDSGDSGGSGGSASAKAARAGFARTGTGPFVTTVVTGYEDTGDARRAVDAFRTAARECDAFHDEEGPSGDSVTVAYEARRAREVDGLKDIRSLGEDSAAVRFDRRLEGQVIVPVLAEAVIVRVGAHVVRVAQAGRDDPGTGSIAPIARRAAEKLAQVARGVTPTPEADQPGTTDL